MFTLEKAKKIAIEAGNKLLPWCDKLNLAGSIRRGCKEVHDIEIVCLPKYVKAGQIDLWTNEVQKEQVHPKFIETVLNLGKAIKGKPDGRYMQIELKTGHMPATIMVDLFMPQPADYYRIFSIRTGSAKYSHQRIAEGWRKLGWVGTSEGLRRETECLGTPLPDGKTKWKCIVDNPTLPPVWQTEEEFFNWLGIQYIPPAIRYVS